MNKGLEALQKLRDLVEYLTRIDYVPRDLRDEVKELLIKSYKDSNGYFSQIEEALKRNESDAQLKKKEVSIMKYRKKPIVIEAFKYEGDLMNSDGSYCVPDWAVKAYDSGILFVDAINGEEPPYDLFINTLEGRMLVNVGDYVIQGINGELYPCKPDIFEKTYDIVND